MMDYNMRKLASIRRIADIQPIEGADAIEVATIDGWKVVVKRGEFAIDELAVYLEIDSFVPHELAPFLSKGQEPRVYNGVKGERLRTIRLRGTTSQGLLLKIENCFDVIEKDGRKYINTLDNQTARSSENEDLQDSKQEQW